MEKMNIPEQWVYSAKVRIFLCFHFAHIILCVSTVVVLSDLG